MKPKVVLIILDGWGLAPAWGGNAISMAETPNMDKFWKNYPHTALKAAEEMVGLPVHEMGNSEVGHLNIGSGQIAYQNLTGINATIDDKSFFKNETLLRACAHVNKNNSILHLLGLVSDGGIHSHINHLFALLDLAKEQNVKNVAIHMITDGRDTDPMKALSYLASLRNKISQVGLGRIVSVMGRYYAMDRDKHWDRVQKAYNVFVRGIGPTAESAEKLIAESYRSNKTDEFIEPTIIQPEDTPFTPLSDNDALVFFNFRADRTKEIINSLAEKDFNHFETKKIQNLFFASFSFLEEYLNNPAVVSVFKLRNIQYPLARVLSEAGLTQFHIAETEKYAHVTFFFDGGKETPYPGEIQFMVQSPKVSTFDLKPEMSAVEVKNKLLGEFKNFDFCVCNFANADMVGHTGNIKATIRACEAIDRCLGEIVPKMIEKNTIVMITADHGNAEEKLNPSTGEPDTEHTTNPVPFILCSNVNELQKPLKLGDRPGILSDIAPTILDLFNLKKPEEMTGRSLINKL